jgi:hypothetical protein
MLSASGSLSFAASWQQKIAAFEFSVPLSKADQKFEKNQGEIKINKKAGRDIAGLSAVPYPTEGETSPWISKPFW